MIYSFGEVVLVPFPFTDQSSIKKRPAIVVSSTPYNRRHMDTILIAVTSQLRAVEYPDNLVIESWTQAGLLRPSVIKPIMTTIKNDLIIRRLGSLVSRDQQTLQLLLGMIIG